jgi:hypothetical protein
MIAFFYDTWVFIAVFFNFYILAWQIMRLSRGKSAIFHRHKHLPNEQFLP